MEHFKDYIKSVVRSFKTPSVMGYKPTYKTDYIWVTVTTPPKMWTEDMSQEVYTAGTAGYVTSKVPEPSRCVLSNQEMHGQPVYW